MKYPESSRSVARERASTSSVGKSLKIGPFPTNLSDSMRVNSKVHNSQQAFIETLIIRASKYLKVINARNQIIPLAVNKASSWWIRGTKVERF